MMEDVVLEKELEYYSKSTGEKVKALVKVYPSRLVIEKKNELESILIPYINILKYYKDPKWGYLAAGIVLFLLAGIFLFIPAIKNTLIFESPAKELIGGFACISGIACIIS